MFWDLVTGTCSKCGEKVVGEGTGCTAMDQIFHIACFTCRVCDCLLQGKSFFYHVDGKPYCERCYMVFAKTHLVPYIQFSLSLKLGIYVFRVVWKSAVFAVSLLWTVFFVQMENHITQNALLV